MEGEHRPRRRGEAPPRHAPVAALAPPGSFFFESRAESRALSAARRRGSGERKSHRSGIVRRHTRILDEPVIVLVPKSHSLFDQE